MLVAQRRERQRNFREHLQVCDLRDWEAGVAQEERVWGEAGALFLATLRRCVRQVESVGSWVFESAATHTAPLVHRWRVKPGAWGRHLGKAVVGSPGSGLADSGECWLGHCRDRSKGAGAALKGWNTRPPGTPSRVGAEFKSTSLSLALLQCFPAPHTCSHHQGL